MKIGIIGCGHVGSVLARNWIQAGHEVIVSSDHPEMLKVFAKKLGPKASFAPPEETAELSDIVLLSIPFGQIPKLSTRTVNALRGKIVMDTCNPYPERDGKVGIEALNQNTGSGTWVAKHLPGAIIVKAFNTVHYRVLESEAFRQADPIGIPLASNDQKALQVVAQLVREAGFGPVIIGKLARAKDFDNGTAPYASGASAGELEILLGLERKAA